jgi:hypothetical protein
MPKLFKRWYVWLGLVLLLGLAGSVALIWSGRGRITQANFDRIHEGMLEREVGDILGEPDWTEMAGGLRSVYWEAPFWSDGPNWIQVYFDRGKPYVTAKQAHLATTWETLQWYAKKCAAKIGVKWD